MATTQSRNPIISRALAAGAVAGRNINTGGVSNQARSSSTGGGNSSSIGSSSSGGSSNNSNQVTQKVETQLTDMQRQTAQQKLGTITRMETNQQGENTFYNMRGEKYTFPKGGLQYGGATIYDETNRANANKINNEYSQRVQDLATKVIGKEQTSTKTLTPNDISTKKTDLSIFTSQSPFGTIQTQDKEGSLKRIDSVMNKVVNGKYVPVESVDTTKKPDIFSPGGIWNKFKPEAKTLSTGATNVQNKEIKPSIFTQSNAFDILSIQPKPVVQSIDTTKKPDILSPGGIWNTFKPDVQANNNVQTINYSRKVSELNSQIDMFNKNPSFDRDLKELSNLQNQRQQLIAEGSKIGLKDSAKYIYMPGVSKKESDNLMDMFKPEAKYSLIGLSQLDIMREKEKRFKELQNEDFNRISQIIGTDRGKIQDIDSWQGVIDFNAVVNTFNKLVQEGKATPEQIAWMREQMPQGNKIFLEQYGIKRSETSGRMYPERQINVLFPEGEQKIDFVFAPPINVLKEYDKNDKTTWGEYLGGLKSTSEKREKRQVDRDTQKIIDFLLLKQQFRTTTKPEDILNFETEAKNLSEENLNFLKGQEEIMGTQGRIDFFKEKLDTAKKNSESKDVIANWENQLKMAEERHKQAPTFGLQEQINFKTKIAEDLYKNYLQNPTDENYNNYIVPIIGEINQLESVRNLKADAVINTGKIFDTKFQALQSKADLINKDVDMSNSISKKIEETIGANKEFNKYYGDKDLIGKWQEKSLGESTFLNTVIYGAGVTGEITKGMLQTVPKAGVEIFKGIKNFGKLSVPERTLLILNPGGYGIGKSNVISTEKTGKLPAILTPGNLDVGNMLNQMIAGGMASSFAKGLLRKASTTPVAKEALSKILVRSGIKGTLLSGLMVGPVAYDAWKRKDTDKMTIDEAMFSSFGNLAAIAALEGMFAGAYKAGTKVQTKIESAKLNKELSNWIKNELGDFAQEYKGMVKQNAGKTEATQIGKMVSEEKTLFNNAKVQIEGTPVTRRVAGQPVTTNTGKPYIIDNRGYVYEQGDTGNIMGTESTLDLRMKITTPDGKILYQNLGKIESGATGVIKTIGDKSTFFEFGETIFTPPKSSNWFKNLFNKPKSKFSIQTSRTELENFKLGDVTDTKFKQASTSSEPIKISKKMKNLKLSEIDNILSRREGGELVDRGVKDFEYSFNFEKELNEKILDGTGKLSTNILTKGRIFSEPPIQRTGSLEVSKGLTQKQMQALQGQKMLERFEGASISKKIGNKQGRGQVVLDKQGNVDIKYNSLNLGPVLGVDIGAPTGSFSARDLRGLNFRGEMFIPDEAVGTTKSGNIKLTEKPSSNVKQELISEQTTINENIYDKKLKQFLERPQEFNIGENLKGNVNFGSKLVSKLEMIYPKTSFLGGFGVAETKLTGSGQLVSQKLSLSGLFGEPKVSSEAFMTDVKIGDLVSAKPVSMPAVDTGTTVDMTKVSSSKMEELLYTGFIPFGGFTGGFTGGGGILPIGGFRPASTLPIGERSYSRGKNIQSWIVTNPIKTYSEVFGKRRKKYSKIITPQEQYFNNQQKVMGKMGFSNNRFEQRLKEII